MISPWLKIIQLGGTAVMIPAASAIAALLLTCRAWRMALWWCLLFAAGLSLVAASKIAFLGWGLGILSLDFKALSGHAMLTTAIIPVMFFLLLQWASPIMRTAGILLAIVFSVIMAICLIAFNFHSASEAIAGCTLGGIVSLGFIKISSTLPAVRLNRRHILFSILAFLVVQYAKPPSIEYWIERAALYISGHDKLYNWTSWQLDT